MKTNVHILSYRAKFVLEWEMIRRTLKSKSKCTFVLNKCFSKWCRLWDDVIKYSTEGQATDDNMAHASSTLDSYGNRLALIICNI